MIPPVLMKLLTVWQSKSCRAERPLPNKSNTSHGSSPGCWMAEVNLFFRWFRQTGDRIPAMARALNREPPRGGAPPGPARGIRQNRPRRRGASAPWWLGFDPLSNGQQPGAVFMLLSSDRIVCLPASSNTGSGRIHGGDDVVWRRDVLETAYGDGSDRGGAVVIGMIRLFGNRRGHEAPPRGSGCFLTRFRANPLFRSSF